MLWGHYCTFWPLKGRPSKLTNILENKPSYLFQKDIDAFRLSIFTFINNHKHLRKWGVIFCLRIEDEHESFYFLVSNPKNLSFI